MSDRDANTTLIRGIYDAFAAGDLPAVLAAFSPAIRWHEAEGFPYGGLYEGPDAIVENVFARLGSEWDGFAAAPQQFVCDGDTVVVLGVYSGIYKATGKGFAAPLAHVWKIGDGRVVEFRQHTDTALVQRALEAD